MEETKSFVNQTPTILHCIEQSKKLLKDSGYTELDEKIEWTTIPNKFFVIISNKIIAFNILGLNKGIVITVNGDSPGFEIKPHSLIVQNNYEQLNLIPHGQGLWSSWLDRDLTISGKVFFKKDGKTKSKLIHCSSPVASIPSLAIHLLSRDCNYNLKEHFNAIINPHIIESFPLDSNHSPSLMKIISKECECNVQDIVDFDLFMVSHQKCSTVGINNEFLNGQRLSSSVPTIIGLKQFIGTKPSQGNFISFIIHDGSNYVNSFNSILKRIGTKQNIFRNLFFVPIKCFNQNKIVEFDQTPLGSGPFYVCKNNLNNKIIELTMKNSEKVNVVHVDEVDEAEQMGATAVGIGFPVIGMNSIRETAAVCDIEKIEKLLKVILSNEITNC